MVHLLHGEHVEITRRELSKFREEYSKDYEVIYYDGKKVDLDEIQRAFQSIGLFGDKRCIVIENLISQKVGRSKTELEQFKTILDQIPQDLIVIFWEGRELTKTMLKVFPKGTDIAIFRPDKTIFALMDAVRPKNTKDLLSKYHTAVNQDSPELIFAMLVRQFRYLLMSKTTQSIPLSPWQRSKFRKTAQLFTEEGLFSQYSQLLSIDVRIKSGNNAFELKQGLEYFLLNV